MPTPRTLPVLHAILCLLSPLARGGEPLDYSVSWIGNTFSGGDAGWVPQDVEDIFVMPDGTVYTTVGWEEHRGNIAAFRDGKLIQQTAHWKDGGIDRIVGETITANADYVFYATGTPDSNDKELEMAILARRDRADIASRKLEKRVEVGRRISGVAASGERVFAACDDGRIRVFDMELETAGDWPAPSPGEMAVDASGKLWIIDNAAKVVRRFDADGKELPQVVRFPDGVIPMDVAVTPGGNLLVADGGRNRQVLVYHRIDTEPELERTLGEKGGAFAGDRPGAFGDRRFVAPTAVGGDAEGNVCVACGPYAETQGGTAVIQSYASDDRLNWRVMSTEWLSTVDVDRTSGGTVLHGSKYRYSLDPGLPPGRQWAVEAITLHPDKYPGDPRLQSAKVGGVWHRRIGERDYLFMPDMNGGNLYVFRSDPGKEGEIAVFCAHISTAELWVDRNGNGTKDTGETADNPTGETRGWDVEDDGTIWQATLNGGIFTYPLGNFLESGVPDYRIADRKRFPTPAPFTELRRIVYDRAEDTMYLGGSTESAPAGHWKPMGPNLARYDQWHGGRRLAWHKVLPHEKSENIHESYEPSDLAVEGDHVFVVYVGMLPSQNLPAGTVMAFARSDGRHLGHFQPTGTRTGKVPMDALQDIVHSMNVYRRADGEYFIFIEDDGYTKNILYRWKP